MKKNKNLFLLIGVFIIVIAITSIITIILYKKNNKNYISSEKIISEMSYLDNKISKIYLYLGQDTVDWDKIKNETIDIYSSWNTIIIDLTNFQIKNSDLTSFGKKLDDISIAIKEKNPSKTLLNISDLYALLTSYADSINIDSYMSLQFKSKVYLLKAYSFVYIDEWNLVSENIVNAERVLYNYLIQVDNAINDNSKINEIYISIREIENTITLKNKEISILKLKIIFNNY